MSCLHYKNNDLYIEDVALKQIATEFATPCYIYSQKQIENNWHAYANGFKDVAHQICYAVKANGNLSILKLLASFGSGFDIVSLGELKRVQMAGGDLQKVIFSGVGKTAFEIEQAILAGIGCFNVESVAELNRLHAIAEKLKQKVNIALRVNPNVNASTHAHIATGKKENKFGIDIASIPELCTDIVKLPWVNLTGIAAHIGSQITDMEPFLLSLDKLLSLYQALAKENIKLTHINIGGGLGIRYHDETPPSISEYAEAIKQKIAAYPVQLRLEPGRAIIANAGVLLTQVEYIKFEGHKYFAIVDAGMNDFLRSALYGAWQNILPVLQRLGDKTSYDIAGPVCESADFFGKDRLLNLAAGDLIAIDTTGAYGFSMSSNYNARLRPAEVMVNGTKSRLIRRRESYDELTMHEVGL